MGNKSRTKSPKIEKPPEERMEATLYGIRIAAGRSPLSRKYFNPRAREGDLRPLPHSRMGIILPLFYVTDYLGLFITIAR
jgi:hypothetical protein